MTKSGVVEKFGTVGALLAAVACPACFPILAVVGTALGLGIFHPFEGWVFVAFQVLVFIALVGNIFSFFCHRRVFPLILGVASPALIFFVLYVWFNQPLLYLGLLGLAAASVFNYIASRQSVRCIAKSIITCPQCGFAKEESMPTDACQFFYQCTNCGAALKPKPGDCCVFCSYGSVKCPPKQTEQLAA